MATYLVPVMNEAVTETKWNLGVLSDRLANPHVRSSTANGVVPDYRCPWLAAKGLLQKGLRLCGEG
jgi:hypothetical protein